MTLARLDPARLTFHLVALPKGVKGTRAAGFLGAEPAGTYAKSATKTFLCTSKGAIALRKPERGATIGPGPLHPGTLWTGKRNVPQAVVWTVGDGNVVGCALPTAGFPSSHASAADGMNVVGTGEKPGDDPSRALLWKAGAEPILLANPRDPSAGTAAYAIAGDVQGGTSGGLNPGACIWQGSSDSFVSLHPAGTDTSCVRGVSESEQVGEFESELDTGALKRAALWRGSSDSFVDLTPRGVASAVARAVVAGFQAGWVEETPRSQLFRAWLWAGSANHSLDLHPTVGGEWTASAVSQIRLVGKRLLLLGTVEQRRADAYRTLVAEQACWWDYALD